MERTASAPRRIEVSATASGGIIYVLDFYCAAARLAIEVDGAAHDSEAAVKRDEARSHFLRSKGVATLRGPAAIVLEDVGAAVRRIVEVCSKRVTKIALHSRVPLHCPADGPPPPWGEDL